MPKCHALVVSKIFNILVIHIFQEASVLRYGRIPKAQDRVKLVISLFIRLSFIKRVIVYVVENSPDGV